jgi:hypothetical protein
MLEKKLQEELNRYKAINKYGKTMIMEQDAPPPPDAGAPLPDPGAAPAPTDPGAAPLDPAAGAPPPTDPGAAAPPSSMDTTEELDITDLVDMVKSVKKGQEDSTGTHSEITTKMDDVFTKLNDLESKLGEMNQVIAKIDQLGQKIQQMKPQTPQEKLEMRSLDSYPFNEKPQEFFAHKQGEMQASGKNEYVLTKDEVQDYSNNMIKDTFNQPTKEEDEYKF